ncbi:two-component system sensor histidine kinase YesM [Gracilibacillus halotolerans]|uniref:Two-component system sensor histidine kinase YesM n=1 Tax=Gracilibacillus halotolerans TaxID=74386 RepID=A0A841RN90_9BACI|nr:sensor histidine kinase [Gracilibacillus halotolerans]MBB6512414.1 two-component system sensor histidine kinase YesM [Gracilibacillus halotolerans]
MISKFLKFKNYRLMPKLIIIYSLLTVIPMAILGYIAYSQYISSIEKQAGEYTPLLLEQAHANIHNQIDELKLLPNLIYNSNQVVGVLREEFYQTNSALLHDEFVVNNFLNTTYISGGNPNVLGVFLISNNRLFQATSKSYSGFELDASSFPFGQDFEWTESESIILPKQISLEFEGNPQYILLMKQLTDYDNRKKLGTIFIAYELNFLESIFEKLNSEKGDIWLMNDQGRVIYHSNHEEIGNIHIESNDYPILNGSFRTLNENENKLISLHTSDETGWTLAQSIYLSELTQRTDMVRNVTIIIFIILVIISLFLFVIFVWNVSSPIYRLVKLMKKVETGDFDVDLPTKSKDEVGLLAISFNSMVNKIKDLIKENYHIEIKQKDAELYALQSQINPHFMYNTLETIGMVIEEDDQETGVKMVTLLGRMLRYSISNKDRLVSIEKEVSHIEDYLTIQKIRFEDRLTFDIQKELETEQYYIPKFIIQPIVENSIKYGLERIEGIHILVKIKKISNPLNGGEEILLVIEDNGPGIDTERLIYLKKELKSDPTIKKDGSFGLINVHSRIVMTFGSNYGLQITSLESRGTVVRITIPCITSDLVASNLKMGESDNEKDISSYSR